MNALTIAAFGLLMGCLGQMTLYAVAFPLAPPWLVMSILLLPWLIAFSFACLYPARIGRTAMRAGLIAAMCLYAVNAAGVEILNFVSRDESLSFEARFARIFALPALLCFWFFIRAIRRTD